MCIWAALCAHICHLHIHEKFSQLIPFFVVMALLIVVHLCTFGNPEDMLRYAIPLVPSWILYSDTHVTIHAFALGGSLYITLEGLLRGIFLAMRLGLLVIASLILTTTTQATQISEGITRALTPLSRFGIPVRDAGTILSIALRCIPETIDQFLDIKRAQQSRGASFDVGTFSERMHAWIPTFVPLIAQMFRQAERLGCAMDARCYGIGSATHLHIYRIPPQHAITTICICAMLLATSIVL